MKNISINTWVNQEIETLNKEAKRSKIKFSIFAVLNILINITTIITASLAINLLLRNHEDTSTGIILATLSAASVIILFLLNSFIVVYRSIMRAKYYGHAVKKIEIEVMKFKTKQGEYSEKGAEKALMTKIKNIESLTLKKKRNKKVSKTFVKAMLGGGDA